MNARRTSSLSSGLSVSIFPGKTWNARPGLQAPHLREERVPMSTERRMEYALADRRSQFRIAAENPAKMTRLGELLEGHPRARILIIGEYLAQIETIARKFRVPWLRKDAATGT